MKDYQRSFLRPVTAQPSHQACGVASILEQHTAELSAAQEWESEWNSQGLLSRLAPQVGPPSAQLQADDQRRMAGRRPLKSPVDVRVDTCVHGNSGLGAKVSLCC